MSSTVRAPAHSSDSLITLREVLALPVLTRGVPEVIAATQELDRPVRWVHSGEVPYMADMLKGGELLLMTGIGLQQGDRRQRSFVDELAEREIAGLVLELGACFKHPPRALANEAESRELPLVALHHEIRFVEVTEAVHREIVGRQLELMRRGDELHRRFTALMLEGAGVPEVLGELADTIAHPVILDKAEDGILYHATGGEDEATVLAAWDAYARRLPGAPSAIEQQVPTGDDERWGRLVALAVDGPIDQAARMAVERAVGLIAVALLREHAEETVANRERGNFLAGLLESDLDETEARRRAAAMGFERRNNLMLPMAIGRTPSVFPQPGLDEEDSWMLVWRDLRRELESRRIPAIAGTRGRQRELLVVVGLRREDGRAKLADQVAELIASAGERHLGRQDAALLSVGPTMRSWGRLGESLRITVDGLVGAAHNKPRPWHDATRPDLDGLMWSLRDRPEVRRFTESRLAPLIEHDRKRRAKLVPTLAAYCEHGGRKAETARALHIERQSLYHRLARIEGVLAVDLSDGEVVLGLHLALRALQYTSDETA